MNIIIDLHAFTPPFAGKHQYTLSLLDRLFSHPKAKNIHFHLVSNHKFSLPTPPQFTWHILHKSSYYLMLSLLTRNLPQSILLSPTSFIPPVISYCPSITIIYDFAAWQPGSFQKNTKATIIEKSLYSLALYKSSHIITISNFIKNELINKNPKAKNNTSIVYPCTRPFPPPKFDILKQNNLKSSQYILFVGTIEPRKNLPQLLRAYKNYFTHSKRVFPLVLAGNKGWQYQQTFNTIKKLKLERQVIFINSPSDAQLAALYQRCLFFAYIPLYEGFGMPIIEAISFKKPVITSNTSSLPEAVGPCGLTVDPTSTKKISTALTDLSINQQLRTKLASHSAKHLKNLSSNNSIDHLWETICLLGEN